MYESIITELLRYGKTIYLLRHAAHDSRLCNEIKKSFFEEKRVVVLQEEFSCVEFNELVKKFDYLIASRFHSIVHAFKNGIPCIALGWATKYHDLLAQFDQAQYLLDVRQSVERVHIAEMIQKMNQMRNVESCKILKKLEVIQQNNIFDIIQMGKKVNHV